MKRNNKFIKREGFFFLTILLLLLSGSCIALSASDRKSERTGPCPDSAELRRANAGRLRQAEENDSTRVTRHSIAVDGGSLRYTATAGRLKIFDSAGTPTAFVFYTSYILEPRSEIPRRPLTFVFNGGPGASSMWLHMAAAGPRRAVLGADGLQLPKIDTLVDNQYSWLRFTDLVFVDPVGTGYSRPAQGINPERFYSVKGDIETMAKFIRLFLSQNRRWISPLFLAGESYGTLRAAGLCRYLQNKLGIVVDGIIFISSALDFQVIAYESGNDLAYFLSVPSYTAAAFYHKRLPAAGSADLAACLSASERWSMDRYLPALMKGSSLSRTQRTILLDSLSFYTGLSREYLLEYDMRINPFTFARGLLASSNRSLGFLDSRVTCVRNPNEYRDPSLFITDGPLIAVINDYLRRELSYESRLEYRFLSETVNRSWKWGDPSSQGYVDEIDALRESLNINPRLRLFAAMGYFDLTTPYFSQQYCFGHIGPDSTFMDRISLKTYEAGHQIYTNSSSLKALTGDVADFIKRR